jgi:hypothetical protein
MSMQNGEHRPSLVDGAEEPLMPNGDGAHSAPGETYEQLNIEPKPLLPHILAAATVVFGEDYYAGRRETISLSGFVQLNKWPMPGFGHRVDEDGRAEFDLELISAPEVGIKGFSYMLDDRIQVLSNPHLPNTGHVRQIVPGRNFPANFYIRRFGVLETSTLRLAHRDVIDIEGVIDAIPPFKKPLTAPLLGTPMGDGPGTVVPGPNVVRGVNLPEAWYPADEQNQPIGITPTVFFTDSMGPCISMLVDPSIIIQSSAEAEIVVEVEGSRHVVELTGDHRSAAGAELLLFAPDKHGEGAGIRAQLARVALVGECPALGGRVMLRANFFKPSGGSLGTGYEVAVEDVRFPAEIEFEANLDLVTPAGPLYGSAPVLVQGMVDDLDASGTELEMQGPGTTLVRADGEPVSRLIATRIQLGEALVGQQAYMTTA